MYIGRTYGRGHAHTRGSLGPHWSTWLVLGVVLVAVVLLASRELDGGARLANLGRYAGKPGHAPKVGPRAGRGGHR